MFCFVFVYLFLQQRVHFIVIERKKEYELYKIDAGAHTHTAHVHATNV